MSANPGTGRFPTLSSWFRKVVLVGIFAAFPILALQIAVFQIESLEVTRKVHQKFDFHTQLLARIKEQDNDWKMVVRSINRMYAYIRNKPKKIQLAGLRRLNRLFPRHFDIYFFDPQGELVRDLSSKRHPKKAIEMSFESLWNLKTQHLISKGREGLLKTVFNYGEVSQIARSFDNGATMGRRPRDSYVLWSRTAAPGELLGFLALIHAEEIVPSRALRGAINRANKSQKGIGVGFLDTTQGLWDFFPKDRLVRFGLKNEITTSINQYDQFFNSRRYFGAISRRRDGGFIFTYTKKPVFFSEKFTFSLHIFCALWFITAWFKVPNSGEGIAARIPIKLVALFIFAVGTPSLVLLVGGFYALKDHSNVLLQQLEKKVQEKLRMFDERLPTELTRLEHFLKKIIDKAVKVGPGPARQKVFQEFLKEDVLDTVTVVDKNAQEIFNFPKFREMIKTNPTFAPKAKFALVIGREVIKRLNHSNEVDAGTLVMEATTGVLNTMMAGSKAVNLETIMGEFGRFQKMAFAGDAAYLYLDSLPNPDGSVEHAVIGTLSGTSLESYYINKNLHSLCKQPDLKWRICALGDWAGRKNNSVSKYVQIILSDKNDKESALEVRESVVMNQTSVKKITIRNGAEEFWFGTRTRNLSKYTLIAVVPLRFLNDRIRNLWMALLMVAGLVLFSTSAIGMLLSEQFLQPISDLSGGIKSIESRDFSYQVPIHSPDELGEMSMLMNNVIEGMKDLEVARIVQESLFPPTGLAMGDYVIYGKSRAMTDIGGDYFDYYPDGKKIIGLVGDVSGHGVSAALIMGMAKCAFTMQVENLQNLAENMWKFSQFMLRTIKRKKMMTLFHFCMDTETHTFRYGNGGHNYPFLFIAKEEKIDEIFQESFPLGIRAKAEYSEKELQMGSGDAILFYTDGLIESKNLTGEILNYGRAKKWFGEIAHSEPEKIVNELFEKFDEFTIGCPAEDDLSLICLKRLNTRSKKDSGNIPAQPNSEKA